VLNFELIWVLKILDPYNIQFQYGPIFRSVLLWDGTVPVGSTGRLNIFSLVE